MSKPQCRYNFKFAEGLDSFFFFFNSVSLGKNIGDGVDPLNSTYK